MKRQKLQKKIVNERKSGSLKTLLDAFQEELQSFKTHSYNIVHQYKEYRRCTKRLDERIIALHIDFSENYSCKLSTEIQAMHLELHGNRLLCIRESCILQKVINVLHLFTLTTNTGQMPFGLISCQC